MPESLRKIRAGLNALTNLDDITSCSLIGDVLETVTESLCTTVTSALDRMLWGFGLCGGLLVLAVAISIKGMKAFLKPPEQPQQKEFDNIEMGQQPPPLHPQPGQPQSPYYGQQGQQGQYGQAPPAYGQQQAPPPPGYGQPRSQGRPQGRGQQGQGGQQGAGGRRAR